MNLNFDEGTLLRLQCPPPSCLPRLVHHAVGFKYSELIN